MKLRLTKLECIIGTIPVQIDRPAGKFWFPILDDHIELPPGYVRHIVRERGGAVYSFELIEHTAVVYS